MKVFRRIFLGYVLYLNGVMFIGVYEYGTGLEDVGDPIQSWIILFKCLNEQQVGM
jgi:hypothetical protein